jgi:hypothetical protein
MENKNDANKVILSESVASGNPEDASRQKASLATKILKSLIVLVPIGISLTAIWYSCEANETAKNANVISERFGTVSAVPQWSAVEEEFYVADNTVKEWEESKGYQRTGIVPNNFSELEDALDSLDATDDVKEMYRQRWRAQRNLTAMADAYKELFGEWFLDLEFDVPSHPPLPQGILSPITEVSFDDMHCVFAGISAPCASLIRSDILEIPEEIIGPEGHLFAGVPKLEIYLPFSIQHTDKGYQFDVEMNDENGESVIRIENNLWTLLKPTLPYKYDETRLEVLTTNGIVLFQIEMDDDSKTVYIGGNFISTSGDQVIALPNTLITPWIIVENISYLPPPESRFEGKNMILYPSSEQMAEALTHLPRLFHYEEEFDVDKH